MRRKIAKIYIRVEPQLVEKIDAFARPAATASEPSRRDRPHDRAFPGE